MQKVLPTQKPYLTATLEEFFEGLQGSLDTMRMPREVTDAMAGEGPSGDYRFCVEMEDKNFNFGVMEITIEDRELAARFITVTAFTQMMFVSHIMKVMHDQDVNHVHLEVLWAKSKRRTIHVWRSGSSPGFGLHFCLLK